MLMFGMATMPLRVGVGIAGIINCHRRARVFFDAGDVQRRRWRAAVGVHRLLQRGFKHDDLPLIRFAVRRRASCWRWRCSRK